MEEKQYQGPGVFNGLSTNKAYKGQYVTVIIDSKVAMEIDLEAPSPTENNAPGAEPDEPLFFKHSLLIKYPKEAEGDMQTFIGGTIAS